MKEKKREGVGRGREKRRRGERGERRERGGGRGMREIDLSFGVRSEHDTTPDRTERRPRKWFRQIDPHNGPWRPAWPSYFLLNRQPGTVLGHSMGYSLEEAHVYITQVRSNAKVSPRQCGQFKLLKPHGNHPSLWQHLFQKCSQNTQNPLESEPPPLFLVVNLNNSDKK
jgi:hypothetical protein